MQLPINNYIPILLDAAAVAVMYKAYNHKTLVKSIS